MINTEGGLQGVVLSSGGADGAYGVGVMKALFTGQSPATAYRPLKPAVFVGTSIGAFNAAFIVSRLETDAAAAVASLENVWREDIAESSQGYGNGLYRTRLDVRRFLDPQWLISHPFLSCASLVKDSLFLAQDWLRRGNDLVVSSEPLEHRLLHFLNLSTFISSEPLLRLIEREIRFDNIRRSETALRVLATNWRQGSLEVFSNEKLTDELGPQIIISSAAVPGFFPSVTIGGDPYVDGAVLGYIRLAPAIDHGADTLHLIYLDPDIDKIPIEALESTFEMMYRIFVVGWAARINEGVDAIARVNRQLEVVEEIKANLSETDLQSLLRTLLPYGRFMKRIYKITLHRYHPREDLGALGFLNLDRERLIGLIERGFNDAVMHDCAREKCVLPRSSGYFDIPDGMGESEHTRS